MVSSYYLFHFGGSWSICYVVSPSLSCHEVFIQLKIVLLNYCTISVAAWCVPLFRGKAKKVKFQIAS